MTIEYKIRDEKLHYHINRAAAKLFALWSGKIDKYYLAGEEILSPEQYRIMESLNLLIQFLVSHLKNK